MNVFETSLKVYTTLEWEFASKEKDQQLDERTEFLGRLH